MTDQIDFNVLSRVPSDARGEKAAQLHLPVCSACGAVVPPGVQTTHRMWHAQIKSDMEAYKRSRDDDEPFIVGPGYGPREPSEGVSRG